jgi:hypothetical protein
VEPETLSAAIIDFSSSASKICVPVPN